MSLSAYSATSDLVHRYYQSKKGWTMFTMLLLGAFLGAGLGALGFQAGLLAGSGTAFSAAATGAVWGAGLNLAIGGFSSGSFNLSQTQNFMQSTAQGGIVGWTANSAELLATLDSRG